MSEHYIKQNLPPSNFPWTYYPLLSNVEPRETFLPHGRPTDIWGEPPFLTPWSHEWPVVHQFSYASTVTKNGPNTAGRLLFGIAIQHSTELYSFFFPSLNKYFSYFWDTFKINPFSSHPEPPPPLTTLKLPLTLYSYLWFFSHRVQVSWFTVTIWPQLLFLLLPDFLVHLSPPQLCSRAPVLSTLLISHWTLKCSAHFPCFLF